MTEREKVIKGLECCDGYCDDETGCPYFDELEPFDCQEQLRADAIALLKAQEPVEPTIGGDADGTCRNWWYQCGKCKEAIDYHDKYCRNCGQAVKWDA
jgi:hypothetical protein